MIPWIGPVEFNLLTVMPSSVFGHEMFNYFFTLVTFAGVMAFGIGCLVDLIRRT